MDATAANTDQFRYIMDILTLLVLGGGLAVAIHHLRTAKEQLNADLAAIRRNNALDAIRRFTELMQVEMIGATGEILDRLPVNDVKRIRALVPIEINPDLRPFITTVICASHGACQCNCLECKHFFNEKSPGRIEITLHATILLRRRFAIYFNSHENVFSTWNSGIAEKEMIEEEFKYISEKDPGKEHSKFSEMLMRFDPNGKNFPNSKKFLASKGEKTDDKEYQEVGTQS